LLKSIDLAEKNSELQQNKALKIEIFCKLLMARTCTFTFPTGAQCSAWALSGSPRCRHHQVKISATRRRKKAAEELEVRRRQFMAGSFRDLNWGSLNDLHLANEWHRLGWISRGEHALIRATYSFKRKIMGGKQFSNAELQYILNNHDKVRQ
jgi:hypothetical protein